MGGGDYLDGAQCNHINPYGRKRSRRFVRDVTIEKEEIQIMGGLNLHHWL